MANEARAKGNAAFSSGDFATAIRHFSEAIDLSPTNHVLYSNRSAAYASLQNYTEALTDAKKTVELRPDWSKGYSRLGAAHYGLSQYDSAVSAYKKGLEIVPNNEPLKSGLADAQKAAAYKAKAKGNAAFSSGDFATAIRHCSEAINLTPNNHVLYSNRSASYASLQIYTNALTDSMKTAELKPDWSKGYSRLGAAHIGLSQFDDAFSAYKKELEIDPNNEPLKSGLADAQKAAYKKEKESVNAACKKKDPDTAIQDYSKALEFDDQDVSFLINRAAVYLEMGKYEDCIKDCDMAVEREREPRSDYKMIARALTRRWNALGKTAISSKDHVKKNVMKLESNSEKSISQLLLLSEDLVIDILSRVSLKSLLSSARYVCKSWATIIHSSNFAIQQCTHSKPGLLVENKSMSYYFLDIKDDLNGRFERIDLGTYSGMGNLRSTCDGILLFWNFPKQIFVVNPILKCRLRVPPLPSQESLTMDSLAIARVPHSSIFKLFFVDIRKVSGVDWVVFYMLKIGIDNSWKEIVARLKVLKEKYFFKKPVYSGGNDLYWILKESVIVMDVDKEVIVREYPLPPLQVCRSLDVEYIWMGNHLSCIVHEDPTKTFQIYILDINSGKWSLDHEMVLFDYVVACGQLSLNNTKLILISILFGMNEHFIFQICFPTKEKSATYFKKIHLGYNVKTRQLTKIEGIPEGFHDVFLHTNSLASFPI